MGGSPTETYLNVTSAVTERCFNINHSEGESLSSDAVRGFVWQALKDGILLFFIMYLIDLFSNLDMKCFISLDSK